MSCSMTLSSMPKRGKYLPARSPPRPPRASETTVSTTRRSARDMAGGRHRPRTERPQRMRVGLTYSAGKSPPSSLVWSRSGSGCLSVGLKLWISWITLSKKLLECLIGVLISEDASGLLSVELVSGVINTSLDALVKGHTVGGNFVPEFLIDFQSEMSSHDIIVFGKIGVCVFCGVFAALPWFVVAHAVFSIKFLD